MNGTEFARISGSYSTALIGTYERTGQSTTNNTTTFVLREYFYYGGSTSVSGSSSSYYFKLDGNTTHSGSYRYYPGYTLLGSKTITVTHNNDGSFPGRSVSIQGSSYHINGTKSGNLSAPKINRIATVSNVTDFTDETNPTVTFSNPGGMSLQPYINIYKNGSAIKTIYRTKGSYTSPYTWELTETERNEIRALFPDTNTFTCTVGLDSYSGNTKTGYNSKTKTVNIVNANPTFSNFTFADVNSTTTALTGNNQKIIKGYSNVTVTITSGNKAVAKKSATMVDYRFTCGDKSNESAMPYSESSTVTGTITGVPNGTFNVYATDTRQNSTLVTKLATTEVNYTPLTKGDITLARENGVSEATRLTFSGTINTVNFGSVTNGIKTAKYRYKSSTSSTWSSYTNITVPVSNGTYSFNSLISGDLGVDGFDMANSYQLEVLIEDRLSSVTFTANLGSGIPNIALAKDGVGVMGKYDDNVGGLFQIASSPIIERGTGYIKFYDGLMICYGTWSSSVAVTNAWGSLYASGAVNPDVTFAQPFVSIFNCVVSESKQGSGGYSAFMCDTIYSTTKITNVQFIRGTSVSQRIGFDYIAIGTWK